MIHATVVLTNVFEIHTVMRARNCIQLMESTCRIHSVWLCVFVCVCGYSISVLVCKWHDLGTVNTLKLLVDRLCRSAVCSAALQLLWTSESCCIPHDAPLSPSESSLTKAPHMEEAEGEPGTSFREIIFYKIAVNGHMIHFFMLSAISFSESVSSLA